MVNGKQKRPAGNQFDTPEESLAAEAHSTPFDWRVQLTGDAKFPSDRKKQRTGELDGWDFLSLGIPHNTEYLSIPTGISQESPSKQIGLMFDKTHLQHDSRSQDDLENEGHPGNRISKSTLIDFFGPKFQYNNKENGNSPIEDHQITQESDLKDFSGENNCLKGEMENRIEM
ncbi:hypothetical protein PCASD_03339 [Puccinia coronata f. sp. avenae]|uniref:Uncharacterized protein n=1 Tax=Puccinia coronata f. sp. avenae TaxID=200324 RepID=A0A2N5VE04_9BASI|nr:hypothetical protein PCASD_03339 [Puccinia coronata f. sp. avenae]